MRRRRSLLMSRKGLTITMIFLAESANYGESAGIHICQGNLSDIT